MALYDDYLASNKSLLDYYGGLAGKSTGLSSETLAGLRTQAIESVPERFDRQEQDLMTSLQRQNPTGLPMGGEYFRAFGPLQAAKETTRSNLLRDILLENEAEKRRTGDLNNQYALSAAGQYGNLGMSLLGEDRAQGRFESGQALTREQSALDRENAIRLAEIANEPGSFKSLLLASLLGAGTAPGAGGQSLVGKGVDALVDLITGGGGSGSTPTETGTGVPGTDGGGVLGKVGSGVSAAGGALATAFGAIPVAGQIGLAVAGGILLGKKVFGIGNTHEKADEWVNSEQNQFDGLMDDINRQERAGLSPELAAEARKRLITQYVEAARAFAAQGKDQRRVIDQAFETLRQRYAPELQAAMVAGYLDVPQSYQQQGWF